MERDIALLDLAGLSTRTLALVSKRVLGLEVSAQEVSNSMVVILPAAKKFLERPLGTCRWIYLHIDGTSFSVRRTTPIERTNKEFKRRTKSMEQMGVDTLRAMLVFTALRLEFG
jgi:transposase-like protein